MPIGTRVRLASGGPVMTVVDIDPETMRVFCDWRSGAAWFRIVCLDVVRKRWVI